MKKKNQNLDEVVSKVTDVLFADPTYIDLFADRLVEHQKFRSLFLGFLKNQMDLGNYEVSVSYTIKKKEEQKK